MIIRGKTTTITVTESARRVIAGCTLALAALSPAVAMAASAASGSTQVNVHRDSAGVRLETSHAPLSEVLAALESTFSMEHRTSVPLDQPISGTYRGALRHVLSRLLEGFSYYVADTADGRMEITIVGRNGAPPNATAAIPQVVNVFPKLVVPPPTVAQVMAERQRAHHRRPPPR